MIGNDMAAIGLAASSATALLQRERTGERQKIATSLLRMGSCEHAVQLQMANSDYSGV